MKRIAVWLVLLAAGGSAALAAPPATNAAAADRVLTIGSSSMRVGVNKVTLIIGSLQRADGVYTGDYRLKVFPYFLKNEKGRLAITVSDAALAGINQGKAVTINGTATTSGKSSRTRNIVAIATPTGPNGGKLKVSFTAGGRKMLFEPDYCLAQPETAAARAQTTSTKL
jgi:hypothetical protein